MRIAINGAGRIGRLLCKLLLEKGHQVVAVNDTMPPGNLAYLLKYDSVYGSYNEVALASTDTLTVGSVSVKLLCVPDPENLPWKALGIDLVIECSGKFTTRNAASKHLRAGARRVLLSTTGSADIPLIIRGFNDEVLATDDVILSPGGCMTNCTSLLIKTILDSFGIESLHINVMHSFTSRQSLVDGPHTEFRRGRAATLSIIPAEIDLAQTLERLFPVIHGKIATTSTRVPVECGALADLHFVLKRDVSTEAVNALFEHASKNHLTGVLAFNRDPIVSRDIVGNTHSCVFDATLTKSIGRHLKVSAWFDDVCGFTNRLVEIVNALKK
jgi:glyceraldehyde 3-phosphate dehydrogenase